MMFTSQNRNQRTQIDMIEGLRSPLSPQNNKQNFKSYTTPDSLEPLGPIENLPSRYISHFKPGFDEMEERHANQHSYMPFDQQLGFGGSPRRAPQAPTPSFATTPQDFLPLGYQQQRGH